MRRLVRKPGYLFQFPTQNGEHGYCQWVPHNRARIFLVSTQEELPLKDIVSLPEAFCVLVDRDTPDRYGWSKIGVSDFPSTYNSQPWYAKQDLLTGKITKYQGGGKKEIPATYKEVKNLEPIAIWEHPHIVERLIATLQGKKSAFLKSIRDQMKTTNL